MRDIGGYAKCRILQTIVGNALPPWPSLPYTNVHGLLQERASTPKPAPLDACVRWPFGMM